VQLYGLSRAKVALTVTRTTASGAKERGNLYIEDGMLTNAICGTKRGRDALHHLLQGPPGTLLTRYGIVAKHKEIEQPWETLLAEAEPPVEVQHPAEPSSESAATATAHSQARSTATPSLTPDALQPILEELRDQSDELDHALILDPQGTLIAALPTSDQAQIEALQRIVPNIMTFYQDVRQVLDIGPLAETLILSGDEKLLLLYPLADAGTLSVVTVKEHQGMVRWNCKEALEKIYELMQT
jgi:predicted regulator of Ras-like GTPase activity (Roadblock/LC7/MglB family)